MVPTVKAVWERDVPRPESEIITIDWSGSNTSGPQRGPRPAPEADEFDVALEAALEMWRAANSNLPNHFDQCYDVIQTQPLVQLEDEKFEVPKAFGGITAIKSRKICPEWDSSYFPQEISVVFLIYIQVWLRTLNKLGKPMKGFDLATPEWAARAMRRAWIPPTQWNWYKQLGPQKDFNLIERFNEEDNPCEPFKEKLRNPYDVSFEDRYNNVHTVHMYADTLNDAGDICILMSALESLTIREEPEKKPGHQADQSPKEDALEDKPNWEFENDFVDTITWDEDLAWERRRIITEFRSRDWSPDSLAYYRHLLRKFMIDVVKFLPKFWSVEKDYKAEHETELKRLSKKWETELEQMRDVYSSDPEST